MTIKTSYTPTGIGCSGVIMMRCGFAGTVTITAFMIITTIIVTVMGMPSRFGAVVYRADRAVRVI